VPVGGWCIAKVIGPLAYIGGKRRLAPTIASLLPPHRTYVEPFAGGAQVFFHKQPSHIEVLNDLDEEVVNFLRVCQQHVEELIRWLKWTAASRRLFEIFSTQRPEALTDIQRAAKFLYVQKNAFGGRRHRQTFAYAVTSKVRYSADRLTASLERAAARLSKVQLECLPYEQILARYDRPGTLFYCDPPYWSVALYKHNFVDHDFEELARRLRQIRGTFLLPQRCSAGPFTVCGFPLS